MDMSKITRANTITFQNDSHTNEEDYVIIRNLSKKYEDIVALDNINLTIKGGELFGLLGPNGAGKSTMINILSGLLKPTSGSAIVRGFDVNSHANEMKKLIGVCPQEPAFFSYLSGRENAEFFGLMQGISKKKVRENLDKLLEKLGMYENADRLVGKYSGGMVRRISMIMALVHDPQILFLDEPTVAMDPQARHAVWDFIKELKTQHKTIILTTHYMEEAELLCDRIGIIDRGKLIELGTPAELLSKHNAQTLEDVFIKITGRKIREAI
jgi:ABC-2 type transport system ATP-binding protein